MTTRATTAAHIRCDLETRDRIAAMSRADGVTQGALVARLVADELARRDHSATTRDHTGDHSAEAGLLRDEVARLTAELERSRAAEADLRTLLHEAHAVAQTQAVAAAKPSLADRVRHLLRRGERLHSGA